MEVHIHKWIYIKIKLRYNNNYNNKYILFKTLKITLKEHSYLNKKWVDKILLNYMGIITHFIYNINLLLVIFKGQMDHQRICNLSLINHCSLQIMYIVIQLILVSKITLRQFLIMHLEQLKIMNIMASTMGQWLTCKI
jgi:hypothetical protein